MSDELMTLVDRHNHVLGSISRNRFVFGSSCHRACYILVFIPDGRLLVQKRTENKAFCPGYYGITTGGVVAWGETYLTAARRELQEELGLNLPLTEQGRFYTEGKDFKIWGELYSCCYDRNQHGELALQSDEVASVSIMSIEEILYNKHNVAFTPDSRDALVHYVKSR